MEETSTDDPAVTKDQSVTEKEPAVTQDQAAPSDWPSPLPPLADEPSKSFDICEKWDLVVQLKTNNRLIDYCVSRAVFCLASPVFSKMVDWDSPFPSTKRRSRSDGSLHWYLNLFDDDPEALLVLLRVIHLRMELIPAGAITFPQLLALAKLVDKYDCVEILAPWINGWTSALYQKALSTGNECWLYICIVFGESRNFKELTRLLITEFAANNNSDDDGKRQQRSDTTVSISDIPEKIFADIWQSRAKALIEWHSFARIIVEYFEGVAQRTVTDKNCSETCTAAAYGRFVLHAQSRCIWNYIKQEKMDSKIAEEVWSSVELLKDSILDALGKVEDTRGEISHFSSCELGSIITEAKGRVQKAFDGIKGSDHKKYSRYVAKIPAVWETV